MEAVALPIRLSDVAALDAIVERSDALVCDAIEPPVRRFFDYVDHRLAGGDPVFALLDRNLTTRAIALGSGARVDHTRPDSESFRVAAACMAFLISADISIEPNISIYEVASGYTESELAKHVRAFRLADNLDPQLFLNIALRRASHIPAQAIKEARLRLSREPGARIDATVFYRRVRHWRRHCTALFKIAELERTRASQVEKVCSFIDWSEKEAFFDGVAIAFSFVFFGRARPAKMLKGVNSTSLDRCVSGVSNAAWDLTYISYWTKYTHQVGRIWILCSNDRAVRQIARSSIARNQSIERLLNENWSGTEARYILEHYETRANRAMTDPSRASMMPSRFEALDGIAADARAGLERTFGQP